MKVKKITHNILRNLTKPTGKQFYIIEEGALGFGIRVSRNGHAVYVLRSKSNGQTKDLNIANVNELSPREARQKANALLLSLQTSQVNLDIAQANANDDVTLREAFEDYYAKLCSDYNCFDVPTTCFIERARSFKGLPHPEKMLRFFHKFLKHFDPSLSINDVKPIDLSKYYSMRSSEAKSVANKEMTYLKRVFSEELNKGRLKHNPVNALKLKKEFPKKSGIPLNRLKEFDDHLSYWAEGPEGTWSRRQVILAIRFSIATGMRIGEVRSLQWQDTGLNNFVSISEKVAVLRSSKTAATKGTRYVPLLDPALAIVNEIVKHPFNLFVFASNKSNCAVTERSMRNAFNYAKNNLRLPDHIADNITLYCTRHTFTDIMILYFGAEIETISQVLGHSDSKLLERRYLSKDVRFAESLRKKMSMSMHK